MNTNHSHDSKENLLKRVRALAIAQDYVSADSDEYHAYVAKIQAAAERAKAAGAEPWEIAEAIEYDAP